MSLFFPNGLALLFQLSAPVLFTEVTVAFLVLLGSICVRFEVLTAMGMKSTVFCDITPYSPLKVNRRFGGTCRLHLPARGIGQARNQRETGSKQRCVADHFDY
jgi:hypothetical protein